MKRHITFLAALALAASLVGCATGGGVQPAPPHRLGSGAINSLDNPPESVALASSTTTYTLERYTGSIDLIADQFQTDGTNTAACSSPVLECSNSYQSTVDTHTDDTKWIAVTMSTSPPAVVSGAQKFTVSFPAWGCAYRRYSITCSSGSGTLTLTGMRKGG